MDDLINMCQSLLDNEPQSSFVATEYPAIYKMLVVEKVKKSVIQTIQPQLGDEAEALCLLS